MNIALFRHVFVKHSSSHDATRRRIAPPTTNRTMTAPRPGVAYRLGRALFLSLTDVANATPLLRTRGPSFVMPPASGFVPLGDGGDATARELVEAMDSFYDSIVIGSSGEDDPGVVFAGYGEPLLRAETLCDAVGRIREKRHGIRLRVVTNGLVDASIAQKLYEVGVQTVSVNLASANPDEYQRLMAPVDGRSHADVLAFVEAAASAGMDVECVTVQTPGVDIVQAKALALALGAVSFRTREYFP